MLVEDRAPAESNMNRNHMIYLPLTKNRAVSIILLALLYLPGCQILTPQPTKTPTAEPAFVVATVPPQTILNPTLVPTTTPQTEKLDDTTPHEPSVVADSTPYRSQDIETPIASNEALQLVPVTDTTWSNTVNRVEQIQGFRTLALSPDGKLFGAVEARHDETYYVHVWDTLTGVTLWSQESGEPIGTTALRFSPDGSLLVAAASGYVQQIFVWDVSNGSLLHKYDFPGYTNSLSLSPEGNRLAVASFDEGGILVWEIGDGTLMELGPGTGVDFAPDKSYPLLAIARGPRLEDEESPVLLWDLATGQVRYLYEDAFYADGIALSPDGRFLATIVADEAGNSFVRLWNLQDEAEVPIKNDAVGTAQVRHITFSHQGHLAVLTDTLTLWNIRGDFLAQTNAGNIQGFLLMPDGSHLLTYNYEDPVKVWKIP